MGDEYDNDTGDARAWCDHCGESDFAENMGDYRIEGETLILCARCAERECASATPSHMCDETAHYRAGGAA